MDGAFNLIKSLVELPGAVIDLFLTIVEMIGSVFESLFDFYYMLDQFDQTIVDMAASCGSSEFTGMPIVDSIGMFRYLVGDVAFMMIYFTIMIGCLLTIYKIVVLLYEALDALILHTSGVSCKSFFSNMLTKTIK